MSSDLYPERAYRNWRDRSLGSARQIVPLIMEYVRPRSVVDVGCGLGMWASVFLEHGIENLLGIDNQTVPQDSLVIPRDRFMTHDLGRPLQLQARFDLVVSLEVAEHLPPSSAETFVETLTGLGPVVVFSAAIPLQRGRGHINEQWPAYWAELFERRGYRAVDCLRKRIWNDDRVEPYYSQNMVVYVDAERLADYPELQREALAEGERPLALIHPHYYVRRSDFANSSVKWYAQTLAHYARAVLRRLGLARRRGNPAQQRS
jgi:SAM-dependent methyltransferase